MKILNITTFHIISDLLAINKILVAKLATGLGIRHLANSIYMFDFKSSNPKAF